MTLLLKERTTRQPVGIPIFAQPRKLLMKRSTYVPYPLSSPGYRTALRAYNLPVERSICLPPTSRLTVLAQDDPPVVSFDKRGQ